MFKSRVSLLQQTYQPAHQPNKQMKLRDYQELKHFMVPSGCIHEITFGG